MQQLQPQLQYQLSEHVRLLVTDLCQGLVSCSSPGYTAKKMLKPFAQVQQQQFVLLCKFLRAQIPAHVYAALESKLIYCCIKDMWKTCVNRWCCLFLLLLRFALLMTVNRETRTLALSDTERVCFLFIMFNLCLFFCCERERVSEWCVLEEWRWEQQNIESEIKTKQLIRTGSVKEVMGMGFQRHGRKLLVGKYCWYFRADGTFRGGRWHVLGWCWPRGIAVEKNVVWWRTGSAMNMSILKQLLRQTSLQWARELETHGQTAAVDLIASLSDRWSVVVLKVNSDCNVRTHHRRNSDSQSLVVDQPHIQRKWECRSVRGRCGWTMAEMDVSMSSLYAWLVERIWRTHAWTSGRLLLLDAAFETSWRTLTSVIGSELVGAIDFWHSDPTLSRNNRKESTECCL